MTAAPAVGRGDADKTEGLEAAARALASTQGQVERPRTATHSLDAVSIARTLDDVRERLASSQSEDAALRKAAEWFLDNYYLVRRAARQAAQELPPGFLRRLPLLTSGPARGWPRVVPLTQVLAATLAVGPDATVVRRFVRAYQEVTPLTIAELWALPTVLRVAVLRSLVGSLQDLGVADAVPVSEGKEWPAPTVAAGIERSIHCLRVLAEIDWKAFFEDTSRVEAVLRTDPAGVYPRMDFATCDSYRRAVEELSWFSAVSEEEVAQRAVALAQERAPDDRSGHVGCYLVAEGRRGFEAQLGYRPKGIERVRRALTDRPTLTYLALLALFTSVPLLFAPWYVARSGGHWLAILAVTILALVPASIVGITLLQWTLARLLRPRTVPKLDFVRGVPSDARTLVVIPTLLGGAEDVSGMVRQIELHYLSNPDPALQFALLTDDLDSPTMPERGELLERVAREVAFLNVKHGKNDTGPFHLLHRAAKWNPSEECFMGWERKRGKLDELNRMLRGDENTSFTYRVGDPKGLQRIRFVITLDSDTQLPMGSAQRLIGLLAHPLNRATFDETGRLASGYTIVQPRVETSPSSSRSTRFSRIFAGDVGFDIYTHAVSDVYQDLFGSGLYVGKGIYEIDGFMRSLEGRVPENALASHDLFEGIHGRAALASDIVLFEEYPSHYAAYARRVHRWARGDWQLLPWLLPKVPTARAERPSNGLALIEKWKIVDNLRRSLASPLLLLLLVSAWTWLPGRPLVWTLGALAVLLVPIVPALVQDRRRRFEQIGRYALAVVFLAHEAAVAADAAVRAFLRMTITRKHLLQWTSAAHTSHGLTAPGTHVLVWREMLSSPLLALATAALVTLLRPSALLVGAPLLVLWLCAPEVACWVSRPMRARDESLREPDRRKLRLLARRTWLFFETFVGPNDQWLPVDNHQEDPHEQTAHRTSPTNIGMMLLSTLSAYDLGYLGLSELSLRLRNAFDSIARLAHYRGHLLNWYDTKNLEPLLPRYVSTVDSGNFAGCLLALKQGCHEIASATVGRAESWQGLTDSLDIFEDVVESLARRAADSLRSIVGRMRSAVERGRDHTDEAYATLRMLCDELSVELDGELLKLLETGKYSHEAEGLHALRTWTDRLHRELLQMRREFDSLLPWLARSDEPAVEALDLPASLRLDEIPGAAKRLEEELERWEQQRLARAELSPELEASARRLREAFQSARVNAKRLHDELLDLAARADTEARGMSFGLLFDPERKLFHIGYNVTLDQIDSHHYDLLASEARLASYLAIVRHEVPEAHWYALGRPMTRVAGAPALLSWGGTMFEYLMPSLLMRSHQGTLLMDSCELAVRAQMAYAADKKAPWGISESAYARLDAQHTYQYRAFGVPGLGFKRGLEDDLVIAPYATLLALSVRPRAVVENVARLESMGALGAYGLFEAIDLHPDRAPEGRSYAVVRSYMAHHQGMLLVAITNYLKDQTMVERFHSEPTVATGEILLNERTPAAPPPEWPIADHAESGARIVPETASIAAAPWSPRADGRPQAFVWSNGRLTSLVTDSGGGGLRWQGLELTSYRADATRDDGGTALYLRDEEDGRVWRATSSQGRTTFAGHKAEFRRRGEGVSVHVDVAIAPADDVELRQITLHNESDRARRLTVTSAAEPVLLAPEQATRHPAFSKLFVESDVVVELDALVFARRPQSAKDERAVLVHRLVREGTAIVCVGWETDRSAFFGRCGGSGVPRSLARDGGARRGRVGAVLDPIMSLTAGVELKPHGTVTFAFVTAVGRSRGAALDLAGRYGSMHAVRWALRDAEQESPRRLQRARLDADLLQVTQQLYSALLFADPTLRSPPDAIAAGRPCKRRLWGRGISGDDPIVLVRVHDAEAPLLRETLAAQRYLRSCGVRLDLVLVDEQASGYVTEGSGTLRGALAEDDSLDWLNRHGGIFLLGADQLGDDERRLFEASARVLLDTRDGSLGSRMARPAAFAPKSPRFEPTRANDTTARSVPGPTLLFDNGTGGFTEDGREYVVSVRSGQSSPAPWCNVLANPEFGCLVSESSLGVTWSLNSGENRLTPWRNDPVFDTPSEAIYLRDEETAAVWSPTPLPAGRDAETLVRHGIGYTSYTRDSHGLEQELTVFVPPDAPVKVCRLRLKNTLARHRRLTATYYAEWVLGSVREEQQAYIVPEFVRSHGCLLARCSWNDEFEGRVAFLGSDRQTHGFTTDRTEFLGRRGDYACPEALERWNLVGRVDAGVDPCAALQVHLELGPGEQIETHFFLGQAPDRDEALQLAARLQDRAAIDAAWHSVRSFWDGLLGSVQVKTPDVAMDLMLNRWLLYQSLASRVFGRTGFYQSSGAFGYRDQLQDVLALLHPAPARVRSHILEAAAHQFEEGDVLHWWHPPSGRGVRTRCSDDMAWLPFVTAEYVAATGDVAILAERVPFLSGEVLRREENDRYAQFETSTRSAPLIEHCRRALERGLTQGRHGLPLMGDGDWNDGMNRVGAQGRGESVWLGWFLIATMKRFAALCERVGAEASRWRARAESLCAKSEESAWDGAWYLRAFHDDGSLVGSSKERECQIDSIAQTWAVLSGAADGTRARRALRAADERLVREEDKLILLLAPPFDHTSHDPGYIRAYPPGIRENGGQYTHAATWLGWAYVALGEGERAERVFRLLNPVLRTHAAEEAERYRVEPYVLAGDVYGSSPWVGRGGWTWYTGAAAWAWRLGVEGILGLRKEDGELRIEPCIPPAWKGFEAWVRMGAHELHVVVENPDEASTGIALVTVDGVPLDSNRVRLDPGASGTHEVRVRLGTPRRVAQGSHADAEVPARRGESVT